MSKNVSARVIVCSALVGGQKVMFSVPLTCKGLTYGGSHSQFVPIVNADGVTREGFTLVTRKDGTLAVQCAKIISAEGGRTQVPSGGWHEGIKYSISIKLETPRLAVVTMRLETEGNDTQRKLAAYIAPITESTAYAQAVIKAHERRAEVLVKAVTYGLTAEDITPPKAKPAPVTPAPEASPEPVMTAA